MAESNATKTARLDENVKAIKSDVKDLASKFDGFVKDQRNRDEDQMQSNDIRYVLKSELAPIKRIVYGAVGVILLAVLGAILVTIGLNQIPR